MFRLCAAIVRVKFGDLTDRLTLVGKTGKPTNRQAANDDLLSAKKKVVWADGFYFYPTLFKEEAFG